VLAGAAKVKDLLVGRPLDGAERAAVLARPDGLRALVDAWMNTPQFERKLLEFFKQSLQQVGWAEVDLTAQLGYFNGYNRHKTALTEQLKSSMARTAMAFVKERRPFTEVITTRRFLMTLPMMVLYASMDNLPKDDKGGYSSWLLQRHPSLQTEIVPGPATSARSVRQVVTAGPGFTFPVTAAANCTPRKVTGTSALYELRNYVFGWPGGCPELQRGVFTEEEVNAWRWVTIRPPRLGEERTLFWEIDKLADPATTELVLDTPRVGFMTTPAFFANWTTNDSNQFRVNANQTLIVALGRSFNPEDVVVPLADTIVDKEHAGPGSPCYGCHVALDPMRDFFRLNFTLFASVRGEKERAGLPARAGFSFDGSAPRSGTTLDELGEALARHPRFPIAWVQKLCVFANAETCLAEDPEVLRIAKSFESSRFDFWAMALELFSSPLVTFARPTLTAERLGGSLGIARRELLCERLANRAGFAPGCAGTPQLFKIPTLAAGVPGLGFARGAEQAVVPHDPTMFATTAAERLCEEVASTVVAPPGGKADAAVEAATLDRLVTDLLGVWRGDERWAPLREVLVADFKTATTELGLGRLDALKGTFVAACASAPMIAVGF
jgi:hypothetical protein